MRVLVVARCKNGHYAPFITEQAEAIRKQGVVCQFFGITGKGALGYIRHIPGLVKAICDFKPDIVHAHYGLCGLLANLQRRVPVVTTYHGSDINDPKVFRFSKRAILGSRFNIFVSKRNVDLAKPKRDYALIPCGINLEDYPLMEKVEARRVMGLDPVKKYLLFAGAFDNPVKNAFLAHKAAELVPEAAMLELRGYSRLQVATMMQAVDVLLMSSFSEGSPQVIKEAMACGCPIVSVNVGDVAERVSGVDGCFIAARDPVSLSNALHRALAFQGRTDGRNAILRDGLTNDQIARRIVDIYASIC